MPSCAPSTLPVPCDDDATRACHDALLLGCVRPVRLRLYGLAGAFDPASRRLAESPANRLQRKAHFSHGFHRTHRRLPGREGAHSAAACDRLFPAARLVAAADVLGRHRRGRLGPGAVRRPPDRELARRAGRRDARPALRVAALDRGRGDPARSTTASSARRSVALADVREIHSHPGGARSVPEADRVAPGRARRRRADDGGRGARSWRSWPIRPSSRSRATARRGSTASRSSTPTSATIPRRSRASSRSRRTPGSTGATAAGGRRSPSRPTTGPERSSTRSSRSPATHRPQPARLAADSVEAVQLPLRRRPRRPPARPARSRPR